VAAGAPRFANRAYLRVGHDEAKQVRGYKETAQLLRDAAATAVSHKDTLRVLERVDRQRALLDAALEQPVT